MSAGEGHEKGAKEENSANLYEDRMHTQLFGCLEVHSYVIQKDTPRWIHSSYRLTSMRKDCGIFQCKERSVIFK